MSWISSGHLVGSTRAAWKVDYGCRRCGLDMGMAVWAQSFHNCACNQGLYERKYLDLVAKAPTAAAA
jgi:hypothetical protein